MHPVLFRIGTFEVPSFGVMMVFAFLAGIWIATKRASKYGLDKERVQDMGFWALIAGVLGARIVFILQDLGHYLSHPNELLSLRFQGLTSFGGLIFGAVAIIVWCWRTKTPVMRVLDLCAPGFIIGHTVGRFGCLLNGCCFGGTCPKDLPWGIHVTDPWGRMLPELHHPAQVYDAAMNAVVLLVLLAMEKRGKIHIGQLTGYALFLHGITRFIYEFWRAGTVEMVNVGEASSTYWGSLPITQAQAFALLLSAIGAVIVLAFRSAPAIESPEAAVA